MRGMPYRSDGSRSGEIQQDMGLLDSMDKTLRIFAGGLNREVAGLLEKVVLPSSMQFVRDL
jgi:hypothetical protein